MSPPVIRPLSARQCPSPLEVTWLSFFAWFQANSDSHEKETPRGTRCSNRDRPHGPDFDVEGHYNTWATAYDDDLLNEYGYIAPRIAADAFEPLVQDKTQPVIDLACGTGLVGRELNRRGYTCIDGLDLSKGMLTKAEGLGIYRELMQEDLTRRTSIQDGVYPSLICVGSFASGHLGPEHLREIIRVVRPSAPIVIYMNAEHFDVKNFPGTLNKLEDEGLWHALSVEDSNYMDQIDRRGKLIVARSGRAT